MAAKKRRLGGAKTYGARYGRNLRERVAAIRKLTSRKSKCPYCNYIGVKRVASGIFHCSKCDTKFAGKAYAPAKQVVVSTTITQEQFAKAEEGAKE